MVMRTKYNEDLNCNVCSVGKTGNAQLSEAAGLAQEAIEIFFLVIVKLIACPYGFKIPASDE